MADNEVTITIKRKRKRQTGGSASSKRGPILPKRSPEYLSRRRISKGIKFYDLGQLKIDGEWVTHPFYIAPSVTGPPDTEPTIPELDASDYEARDAAVLSEGVSGLTGQGRAITKAHTEVVTFQIYGIGFSLDFDPSQSQMAADGTITLTPEQLNDPAFTISSGVDDPFIPFIQKGSTHFTDNNDPNADAVEFTPTANDLYFIMPILRRPMAHTHNDTDIFDTGFTYQPYPRFVDDPGKIIQGADTLGEYLEAFSLLISLPGIRSFRWPETGLDSYVEVSPAAAVPNELFGATLVYHAPVLFFRYLLAIIKQPSGYVYCWTP